MPAASAKLTSTAGRLRGQTGSVRRARTLTRSLRRLHACARTGIKVRALPASATNRPSSSPPMASLKMVLSSKWSTTMCSKWAEMAPRPRLSPQMSSSTTTFRAQWDAARTMINACVRCLPTYAYSSFITRGLLLASYSVTCRKKRLS